LFFTSLPPSGASISSTRDCKLSRRPISPRRLKRQGMILSYGCCTIRRCRFLPTPFFETPPFFKRRRPQSWRTSFDMSPKLVSSSRVNLDSAPRMGPAWDPVDYLLLPPDVVVVRFLPFFPSGPAAYFFSRLSNRKCLQHFVNQYPLLRPCIGAGLLVFHVICQVQLGLVLFPLCRLTNRTLRIGVDRPTLRFFLLSA